MSNKVDLATALETIRKYDSFLVTAHTSPDGDSLGSILGMRCFLEAIGKSDVTCAIHDPVPHSYEWLPAADSIRSAAEAEGREYDLVVVLDVAHLDRVGDIARLIAPGSPLLVLDHHLEENPAGTHAFIDTTYSSASEIVADLYELAQLPYSAEAAECIYVGLSTDTGGFRYANTNSGSHRRAAVLVDAGVNVAEISRRVFDVMSLPKAALLERVLHRIEREADGKVAFSYLTLADLSETDAKPEDVDGLVNFTRNLAGVEVGLLFREAPNATVKTSMRTTSMVNAAEVLRAFGGGGHAGAAGATLSGDLQENMEQVVAASVDALNADLSV